jgi:hypothetical protein
VLACANGGYDIVVGNWSRDNAASRFIVSYCRCRVKDQRARRAALSHGATTHYTTACACGAASWRGKRAARTAAGAWAFDRSAALVAHPAADLQQVGVDGPCGIADTVAGGSRWEGAAKGVACWQAPAGTVNTAASVHISDVGA